jgi:hypothetical protein
LTCADVGPDLEKRQLTQIRRDPKINQVHLRRHKYSRTDTEKLTR